MAILKSEGQTETERLLAALCEKTFLKLWSYPNPFKGDGKELCDLLVVFEDNILVFFDRESRRFDDTSKDILLTWSRWKKEVIDKQIATALGAEKYIRNGKGDIFLDAALTTPLPVPINRSAARVFKIVVAHGAKEACQRFSADNVSGSLGVSYGDQAGLNAPFIVALDKRNPIHVLDTHNLEIVLSNLDTITDVVAYLCEKEAAIEKYDFLTYCGEEDLLAHYFFNFNDEENRHQIGVAGDFNALMIPEGDWNSFSESAPHQRKLAADKPSYLWDELIQRTSQNAFEGTLIGDGNVFGRPSAIREMAKEPRLHRRFLSDAILSSIKNFNPPADRISRNVSFLPSSAVDRGYVFLQVWHPSRPDFDEYRKIRAALLEIACGAAKGKFPHLNTVVGIAIDAPELAKTNAEDFILLDCRNWSDADAERYRQANVNLRFFQTGSMTVRRKTVSNFPAAPESAFARKIGRNEPCPCGSGLKYKRCCIDRRR